MRSERMRWAWAVLAALLLAGVDARAATVLIRGSADSVTGGVYQYRPNLATSANSTINPIAEVDQDSIWRAVLEFSLAPLAAQGITAADIVSATLELTVQSIGVNDPNPLQIRDISDSYEDGSITTGDFFNAATVLHESEVGPTGENLRPGDVYARDVTSAVKGDIERNPNGYGSDWTGFVLRWATEGVLTWYDNIVFYSNTYGTVAAQPTLRVETIAVPEPGAGALVLLGGLLAGGLVGTERRRRCGKRPS